MTNLAHSQKDQNRVEARLSADFIMHDPKFPRGISDGFEYDEQRAIFRTNSRSREAIQITKGALELYYSSDPADQLVTFSSNITWDDVTKTAKEARVRENQKNTTWDTVTHTAKKAKASYNSKGPLRKLGRSLGDIAPAIVHKLDYAPDEMYIGVVCHGLKFLFDIAIRLAEKRQKILEAFENIPELVKDVHAYDKYFDRDRDYVVLREEFDVCLLTSIAKSIKWLEKPTIWKSVEALIKGPLAAQSVDELMDDVQVKRTKLRSRIHLLNSGRQFWSSKDAESGVRQGGLLLSGQANIKDQVDGTANDVKGMAKSIEYMFHKTQEIHTTTQEMHAMLQQDRDRIKAREAELRREAIGNKFMALFYDSHRKRKQPPVPSTQRPQVSGNRKSRLSGPVTFQTELISFMAVDDSHLLDISRIVENSARFDVQEMRQAYAMANSTDTQTWLNAIRGIMFLNGSGDTRAARESPISASLASLVFRIPENPGTIVLHFFCGLHCESNQAVSGPSGLIRSLIAQLSLKHDFNLAFVDDEAYRDGIRDHDMRTLCETFSAMVCQLPTDCELYCIIDGVSWLETPRWREDFAATIAYICYMVVDPHCRAHFKLLISSPVRSLLLTQELRQYGELANLVEVQSIRLTERDMPTERELAERTRR